MSGQGRHFGIVEGVRSGEESGRRIRVLAGWPIGVGGGIGGPGLHPPRIAASARPPPYYTHPSTARLVPFYNRTLYFCSLTFPRRCPPIESRVKIGSPDTVLYSSLPPHAVDPDVDLEVWNGSSCAPYLSHRDVDIDIFRLGMAVGSLP